MSQGYLQHKEELFELYDKGRLAHTLLLQGPEGSGALALAMDLAEYILKPPSAQVSLFGESQPQTKAPWKMEHPDLHVSFPFISAKPGGKSVCDDFLREWRSFVLADPYVNDLDWLHHQASLLNSKTKNPKGNINTAEVQNFISKLSLKSFGRNPKVAIIWYPEYLGKEGNRLLKTLEEPTSETYFLLVTENSQQILNTILSRCQSILLRPWTDDQVAAALAERHPELSRAQTENILFRASGNVRKAFLMASKTQTISETFVLEWLRAGYLNDLPKITQLSQQFDRESRDTQAEWLEGALHFLRQVLGCRMDEGFRPKLDATQAKAAQKLSAALTLDGIDALTQILEEMIHEIYRNASAKILFADMSFQIHQVMHTQQRPVYMTY